MQGRAQLLWAALAEGQLWGRGAGGRLWPEGIEGARLVRVLQRQVDPVEQLGRLEQTELSSRLIDSRHAVLALGLRAFV